MLTVPEAARAFGLSEFTLRRWVREGALPAVYAGRKALINRDVLIDFLLGGGV